MWSSPKPSNPRDKPNKPVVVYRTEPQGSKKNKAEHRKRTKTRRDMGWGANIKVNSVRLGLKEQDGSCSDLHRPHEPSTDCRLLIKTLIASLSYLSALVLACRLTFKKTVGFMMKNVHAVCTSNRSWQRKSIPVASRCMIYFFLTHHQPISPVFVRWQVSTQADIKKEPEQNNQGFFCHEKQNTSYFCCCLLALIPLFLLFISLFWTLIYSFVCSPLTMLQRGPHMSRALLY